MFLHHSLAHPRAHRAALALAMFLSLLAVAVPTATASTVTAMGTEALVKASPVIVMGQVESVTVGEDPHLGQQDILTWATIRIEENLRGAGGRSHLAVAVPGGILGDRV